MEPDHFGLFRPSFYHNAVARMALVRFREVSPDTEVVSHGLFSEPYPPLRDGRIDVGIRRGVVRASNID